MCLIFTEHVCLVSLICLGDFESILLIRSYDLSKVIFIIWNLFTLITVSAQWKKNYKYIPMYNIVYVLRYMMRAKKYSHTPRVNTQIRYYRVCRRRRSVTSGRIVVFSCGWMGGSKLATCSREPYSCSSNAQPWIRHLLDFPVDRAIVTKSKFLSFITS